jgi:hypothetical protein
MAKPGDKVVDEAEMMAQIAKKGLIQTTNLRPVLDLSA